MFKNHIPPQEFIPKDPRFGSGPSLIPMERLLSLYHRGPHLLGTSHRHDAVKTVVAEAIEGLRHFFHVPKDYDIVLGNGGATFLFDMLPLTLVDKSACHFTCGEFSQKWFLASKKVPWIKTEEKSVKPGKGITPEWVEGVDFLATTLNETSTGVQIPSFPHKKKGALLAVDATSGGGQVPCDIAGTDVFFFSPQKVFASDGGLWVAILSPEAVERSQKISKDQSRYIPEIMRFDHAIENSRKAQTYNTPSVINLYLLNEQVKELNRWGYKMTCQMAKEKADTIYQWATEHSYLSPFIEDVSYRSQAVATINVDERIKVDELTEHLSKNQWVYGIESYRKLGKNQLRIALFHNISFDDLKRLTKLLSFFIEHALA
jgi:phosphoserine aminotransferase